MDNKEKLKEIIEHIKKENDPNDITKLKNINIDNNFNDALKKIFKILYKDHLNNIGNVNNLKEEDLFTYINMYYVEYNKEILKEIVEHIKKENDPNDITKLKNINIDNNYNDALKKIFKILYKDHLNNIGNVNNLKEEDLASYINMYYVEYTKNLDNDKNLNVNNIKKMPNKVNQKLNKSKIYNINGCEIFFGGIQVGYNPKTIGAGCGRYALNNLYGGEYFTACLSQTNFNKAVKYSNNEINSFRKKNNQWNNTQKINLTRMAKYFNTNKKNNSANKPLVSENYSLSLLKFVLDLFGNYTALKITTNDNLYNNLLNYNSYTSYSLGYLIANGGHYSVVKKCKEHFILLDSLNSKPVLITIDEFKEKYKELFSTTNSKNPKGVYLIQKEEPNITSTVQLNKSKQFNKTINLIIKEIPSIQEKNIKPICQELGADYIMFLCMEIITLSNYSSMTNKEKEILLYQKIIEGKDKNLANEINLTNEKDIEPLKKLVKLMIKNNFETRRNEIIENYKTNKLNSPIGQSIGTGNNLNKQKKK